MQLIHAAEFCELTLEEIEEHYKGKQLKAEHVSMEMRRVAESSLKVALRKLKSLAKGGPRHGGDGDTVYSVDLDAAKALARLAMDTIKLSIEQAKEAKPNPKDESTTGKILKSLWEFKKPS